MLANAFEIFLRSLAYSFWPFIFTLIVLYLISKYFNRDYNTKIKTQNEIIKIEKEDMEHLAEKAVNFNTPKIETSFGDQRIGDIFDEKKPEC